ncbi:MAG: CsbD family protein [Haloechinothrix sp.]
MGILDTLKHKAEQLMGGAKEKAGDVTGNESLADSGKADQAKGEAKEATTEFKDKATGTAKDAKDKFTE